MSKNRKSMLRVLLVAPLEKPGLIGGQARAGSILRASLAAHPDVQLRVVEHPHRVAGQTRVGRVWKRLIFFMAYLTALLRRRPHVVHLFSPAGYWAVLEKTSMAICARGVGATTLLNLRSDPRVLLKGLSESRQKRFRKALHRHDGVICQFNALKTFYIGPMGLDPARVFVVPNAVVHRSMTLTDSDYHRRFSVRRIAFVGSVQPEKGLGTLVKAIARCRDAGLPVQADVIGGFSSVEYRDHLNKCCTDLQLNDSVKFHGPQFGDEKTALLNEVSALVLPSRAEGFPNVVLEAAQIGLPVIMSRAGAVDDISLAFGDGIQVFDVDADDQLAAAIAELFKNPERYPGRASAARAGASTFNVENMAEGFLAAYRTACVL